MNSTNIWAIFFLCSIIHTSSKTALLNRCATRAFQMGREPSKKGIKPNDNIDNYNLKKL